MSKTIAEGLVYVGDGRFLPGIPDTDLTTEDLTRLAGEGSPIDLRALLIASGLYVAEPSAKEVRNV